MQYKNSKSSYGLIMKLLHYCLAGLVIYQMSLIGCKNYLLPKGSPLKSELMMLHKATGVVILAFISIMLTWKLANDKPRYPDNMPIYEKLAALIVHSGLYISILVMAVSGMLMSLFSGYAINLYGFIKLDPLFSTNKSIAGILHSIHGIFACLTVILIIIHILAAIKHLIIDKDNIVRRMTWFNKINNVK